MANKITAILDLNAQRFTSGLRGAQHAIAETDGVMNKAKAGWKGAFDAFRSSPLAIAGAGAAVGAFASKAIGEASSLEESINAVNVTFGDAADGVLALGDNAAKSFGLAKSEFNGLAVQFSSFAQNIAGAGGQDVSDVLGDLTKRVADFASVMNLDLATATQVFMSTLAGETEPIRKFGKDISAAAVEQFALAEGLIKSKGELTESIKVQARYGLLMRETESTAGDFANTSDSLANSQRILQAQAKDLAADLGEDLLPVMAGLVTAMSSLVEVADKLKLTDALGFLDDFDDLGTGIGRALRAPFDSAADANIKMAAEFERSVNAARNFDRALLEGLTTFDDVRNKVLELTGSEVAANIVVVEWTNAQKEAGVAAAEMGVGVERAAGAVLDLGEKTANAIPEGRNYTAVQEGIAAAAEKAAEQQNAMAEAVAAAAEAVADAVAGSFQDLEDDLSALDLFDDIQDQLVDVEEAAKAMAEGGEEAARDYNREVRDLQGQLLDLLVNLENIPPQRKVELVAEIRTGDLDRINAALDEITKARFIPITTGIAKTNPAFDAVNVAVGGGGVSGPIFTNPNPAPTGNDYSVTNIVYPIGSTPTSTTNDLRDYDRRNGVR